MNRVKMFFGEVGRILTKIVRTLFSNKQTTAGTCVMLFFLLFAIVGPLVLPYDAIGNPLEKFSSPSAAHLLGTDSQGRDVLAMLMEGTGNIFIIAILTGIFTVVIGLIIGMVSALVGGWTDKILSLITNMFLTIPSFPVLMTIAALITIRDSVTFSVILSLWSWPGLARSVRAQIISLKERDFIQICKVMKMSKAHIIFKELMPNIASYIIINLVMVMRSAITSSVGIMFLGVAEMDPCNWGAMLYEIMNSGAMMIDSALVYILSPIFAIVLFQFGVINLANGLDATLNPRLRIN